MAIHLILLLLRAHRYSVTNVGSLSSYFTCVYIFYYGHIGHVSVISSMHQCDVSQSSIITATPLQHNSIMCRSHVRVNISSYITYYTINYTLWSGM